MTPLKTLAALLAAVMLITTIACGSDQTPPTSTDTAQPTAAALATAVPQTPAPNVTTTLPQPTAATPRDNPATATLAPAPATVSPTPAQPGTLPPPQATQQPTPTGQVPTPTAFATAPANAGICTYTNGVKEAILDALELDSCSSVTDDHLASITSLTVTADRVDPQDVAGLDSITDIDLELTSGVQAHLAALTTLKNASITLTVAPDRRYGHARPSDEEIALHTVPVDFLPHFYGSTHLWGPNDEQSQRYYDPDKVPATGGFDTLSYTIKGGTLRQIYPYDSMAHQLLQQRYLATNLTITDRSIDAIRILSRDHLDSVPTPHPTGESVTNLTLILGYHPDAGNFATSPHFLTEWIRIPKLKIVNESPDRTLQIREEFITTIRTWSDDGPRPYHVEIRGNIEVEPYAFQGNEIATLHLDPRKNGNDHWLVFDEDPYGGRIIPPEGTGWYTGPE